MTLLDGCTVQCPYCGEMLELSIDNSIPQQSYIEDCQICCRPITVLVEVSPEGETEVEVRHEDE